MADPSPPEADQHIREESHGPPPPPAAAAVTDMDDENDTTDTTTTTNGEASAPPQSMREDLRDENRRLQEELGRMQREIEALRRSSSRGRLIHDRPGAADDDFDDNDDNAVSLPSGGIKSKLGQVFAGGGSKQRQYESVAMESPAESPERGSQAVHHRRGHHDNNTADTDLEAGRGGSPSKGSRPPKKPSSAGGGKITSLVANCMKSGAAEGGMHRKAKLSDTDEEDDGKALLNEDDDDDFADHGLHPVNIDGPVSDKDSAVNLGNGVDGTTPFRSVVRDRAGWLVGLLVLQSCSSFILARNEALLESHLVIVQFLTMLVGAGGNAGNQASVRVIRGLAVGTLNERTLRAFLWTEAKMGVALSLILGLAGFLRALVFMVPIAETVAITTSLYMIVLSSVGIGATLPLVMYRCGLDPAHSSTTIQVLMDILGVTMTVWVSGAILNTGIGPALTEFFHHGTVAAAAEEAFVGDDMADVGGGAGDDVLEDIDLE